MLGSALSITTTDTTIDYKQLIPVAESMLE
jgi:hypothetical protein